MMEKTWVLITDARRARCFIRNGSGTPLTEVANFVYPHTSLGGHASQPELAGSAGKGHGRTGHAGTQFEPHTDTTAKERASFARQLADYINSGVATYQCNALVLMATSPMLGELRHHLSSAADKLLKRTVTGDYTHFSGPELTTHIQQALQPPD